MDTVLAGLRSQFGKVFVPDETSLLEDTVGMGMGTYFFGTKVRKVSRESFY